MAWKIEFDPAAMRELDKLGSQIARRILSFLYQRGAHLKTHVALVKRSKVSN